MITSSTVNGVQGLIALNRKEGQSKKQEIKLAEHILLEPFD
jgi:hypothetical protein